MKILSVNICRENTKSGILKFPSQEILGTWQRDGFIYLDGDHVQNLKFHGGTDRAICCFSSEYYSSFGQELDFKKAALVGENFTTEGMTDDRVFLGDIFRIGSMLVQITSNRGPCHVLAKKLKDKSAPQKMLKRLELGYYMRILEKGFVQSGNFVQRIEQADENIRVSMKDYNRIRYFDQANKDGLEKILANPSLSSDEEKKFTKLLEAL